MPRHTHRRRFYLDRGRFFTTFFILSFITFALVIVILQLFKPKPPLHTLKRLPIPKIARVYDLPPLILSTKPSWVLGAQTIDPRDIITYVNRERMNRGIPPLRVNETLMKAAQMRADTILKYNYFSHADPYENITLVTVLPKVNYPFVYATENIGLGGESGKNFVEGFMNSPGHKDNLLDPNLKETGAAVASGPWEKYYFNVAVQLFAVPAGKSEFLGYNQEDVKEYEKLLSDIDIQLGLTREFLAKDIKDKDYYDGWEKILIRQQEIIATLYATMRQEQPLVEPLITLIEEYNRNWELVPQRGGA